MLEFDVRFGDDTQTITDPGPLEFGRDAQGTCKRHVIADPNVSRDQLRVIEVSEGRVRLVNLSQRVPISLSGGEKLAPGASLERDLPVKLGMGKTRVEIRAPEPEEPDGVPLFTIAQPARATEGAPPVQLGGLGDAPSPEEITRWLESVISVQRAAASSPEFYAETARAVVDLVGLDAGFVLLRKGDDWTIVGRHLAPSIADARFSRSVLRKVVAERRTFFGTAAEAGPMATLSQTELVVASPILDEKSEVNGAIYGSRIPALGDTTTTIRPLEAQVVQLLAAAVGSGLARLAREADVARSRVQFEQFFSSELARELERDPKLLEGKVREVTALFADINGFSRMSEVLSPRDVSALVVDVMEALSVCVLEQRGVIVDYIGDAILAMWNAPAEQPDHATRASRAALAMRAAMPTAVASWREKIGKPLNVTIGLATGPVQVGNIGSRRRFKYGPLGHTVNLASRMQGATKQLGVPILLAGATRERLDGDFAVRRLCTLRFVGIDGGVDTFELYGESAPDEWKARRQLYEDALKDFEAKRWSESCRRIYPLLQEDQGHFDYPALTLAARAVECLRSNPANFDPIFALSNK